MKKSWFSRLFAVIFMCCGAGVMAATQAAAAPAVQQPAAQPVYQPMTQQPAAQAVQQPAVQQPVAQTQVKAAPAAEEESGVMFCLARGLCNITTGWLEIPRCMVYDNGFMPVFGLIVGIPEGAAFAVGRTLCGIYDLVSFGTSGDTFHGKRFPHMIFQSKWEYQSKK